MNDDQLNKMDDEMMKKMTPLRERKVNPKLLDGFAASVERCLPAGRQGIAAGKEPVPVRASGWRVAVPVFAVMALAFVVVTRLPNGERPLIPAGHVMELAQLPEPSESSEAVLAEEIEALRELGVWTDEDEQTAGVGSEEEELAEVLA